MLFTHAFHYVINDVMMLFSHPSLPVHVSVGSQSLYHLVFCAEEGKGILMRLECYFTKWKTAVLHRALSFLFKTLDIRCN
jgi:hypothetical protein